MLLQLHLSYDLPFTHIFNQHINAEIEIIRSQLKYLGANIDDNTIFKDISSMKDELNYNGK